jgi:putative DNA methylase
MMKEEKPMSDVRLIERWLPIAEIGIESRRERTPMTPFPAPNRLHVWWARRPLVASRAAILASLLPENADRASFMRALGIHGDPKAAIRKMEQAKRTGVRVLDPYGYSRSFGYVPDQEDMRWIEEECGASVVLDPTAGGGSIPLEARRLGFETICNDLNPVAATLLHATVSYPYEFGGELVQKFEQISQAFKSRVASSINWAFPQSGAPDHYDATYLWARTVVCPYCAGTIPLSPNWRLAPDGTGVRLKPHLASGPDSSGRVCSFEIVDSVDLQSEGTVSRVRTHNQ